MVLPSIIDAFQSVFVGNRQILDRVLIINKLIYSRKRLHKKGVVLRMDMEKSYDHVDWELVDYMLYIFGFGNKWKGWIRNAFHLMHFQFL